MNKRLITITYFIAAILSFLYLPPAEAGINKNQFNAPPNSAKPRIRWYWMNGNVSLPGLKKDLQTMKSVGLAGATLFNIEYGIPAGSVDYMSREWLEKVTHSARFADKLNLDLGIHNCAGWSSSGGPWIQPEGSMKMVVWSSVKLDGGKEINRELPNPTSTQGFYKDIAVLAFPCPVDESPEPDDKHLLPHWKEKAAFNKIQPSSIENPVSIERNKKNIAVIKKDNIINLTDKITDDKKLNWKVPEGDWTVLRFGYTSTGKTNHPATTSGRGLECDKLSREALSKHWEGMFKPLLKNLPEATRDNLRYALIDNYEAGSQNWTNGFPEKFKSHNDYDLLLYLPALTGRVIDSRAVTERFLWDFRNTIAKLYAKNYYQYFTELCRENGLLSVAQTYGNGTFSTLECSAQVDIPMAEFWVGGKPGKTCKLAASAAHIKGRKLVAAEAFSAAPENGAWTNYPGNLKLTGDKAFCQGINHLVLHSFTHQHWNNLRPGMTMGPWGAHLERTNTWWEHGAQQWINYLSRCQYMLQQGHFVGDVLFFVGESIGSNKAALSKNVKQNGYDYDLCSTSTLLNDAKVENNQIYFNNGIGYSLLVLPDSRYLTVEVLQKIKELVADGATVAGPPPKTSPSLRNYPACDTTIKKLVNKVWGACDGETLVQNSFGKGKVFWGKTLTDVLEKINVTPDFSYTGKEKGVKLDFTHRKTEDADIYFIVNETRHFVRTTATMRVDNKYPQIWHPESGRVETVPMYKINDKTVSLPLQLPPQASLFVVFRPLPQKEADVPEYLTAISTAERQILPGTSTWPKTTAPRKLTIEKAVYGVLDNPKKQVDVTDKLRRRIVQNALQVLVSNSLAGDPAPNQQKKLQITYTFNGESHTQAVTMWNFLRIPETDKIDYPNVYLRRKQDAEIEVLFRKSGQYNCIFNSDKEVKLTVDSIPDVEKLEPPWDVTFPINPGTTKDVKFNQLHSWTEHSESAIKYFAGSATYKKEFSLSQDLRKNQEYTFFLDLGKVRNIAEVYVNDKKVGVLWKPPYRVDITKAVKPKNNKLLIKVTNLWPNRLIGNARQGWENVQWSGSRLKQWPDWLDQRSKTCAGKEKIFTTWKHYNADSRLLESGLLGPVRIIPAVRRIIRQQKKENND